MSRRDGKTRPCFRSHFVFCSLARISRDGGAGVWYALFAFTRDPKDVNTFGLAGGSTFRIDYSTGRGRFQ